MPAAPQAPCGWPIRLFSDEPGQLVSVAVESQLHGARFDAVVELRGSAVIIDVLHFGGRDAGFSERHADGARRLFAAFFQAHAVVGFAGGTVAGDLAVDVSAAGAGPLHLLQDEEPGAFGDHEAVAILGKRARSALGFHGSSAWS